MKTQVVKLTVTMYVVPEPEKSDRTKERTARRVRESVMQVVNDEFAEELSECMDFELAKAECVSAEAVEIDVPRECEECGDLVTDEDAAKLSATQIAQCVYLCGECAEERASEEA